MEDQTIYRPLSGQWLKWLASWRGFSLVGTALAFIFVVACGAESGPGEPVSLGLQTAALNSCSGTAGDSEFKKLQVIVRHLNLDGSGKKTFSKSYSYDGNGSLKVGDVPEGHDEEITVIGLDALGEPVLFGRQSHTIVIEGTTNEAAVVLSKYGGFSCPSGANEYTHRIFPSVTDIGNSRYLIAGGLTAVNTTSVTSFEGDDGARKAWVYDARSGLLSKVNSLMNNGRGAHTAVFVPGADKNQVVFFGGTAEMTFNQANGSGFGWSFDTSDALKSVEVLEWTAGDDPTSGQFLATVSDQELYRKRVFGSANIVSNDGLVLVCGGGSWEIDNDEDYKECDVWDVLDNTFISSNIKMHAYRSAHTVGVLASGSQTRLLFVGGTTAKHVAEVYYASSEQRSGAGGHFVKHSPDGIDKIYHHSMTAMTGGRFAVIGGVANKDGNFLPPSADSAWIVTAKAVGAGDYELSVESLGGLGAGRYFHTAHAPSGDALTILGGFTGVGFNAVAEPRYYDAKQGGLVSLAQDEAAIARGGMGSILMDNDTILMAGGISVESDLSVDQNGVIEVYTPSSTPLYR